MTLTAAQVREHAAKHGLPLPDEMASPVREAAPGLRGSREVAIGADQDTEPPDAFEGAEKLLHADFEADMGRRGVWFVRCRTDEAATIPPGYPDFHLMFTAPDGITRGCAIEFKRAAGKPSLRQRERIADMRKLKIPVAVCWNLKDAIAFARKWLLC